MYDPEIPLLGISKISEIRISKRYLHSHDHGSTIHKPIYSVSEKEKKKNPAIWNRVNDLGGHYTKWNKPEGGW